MFVLVQCEAVWSRVWVVAGVLRRMDTVYTMDARRDNDSILLHASDLHGGTTRLAPARAAVAHCRTWACTTSVAWQACLLLNVHAIRLPA